MAQSLASLWGGPHVGMPVHDTKQNLFPRLVTATYSTGQTPLRVNSTRARGRLLATNASRSMVLHEPGIWFDCHPRLHHGGDDPRRVDDTLTALPARPPRSLRGNALTRAAISRPSHAPGARPPAATPSRSARPLPGADRSNGQLLCLDLDRKHTHHVVQPLDKPLRAGA
jgi:hypothetical protein